MNEKNSAEIKQKAWDTANTRMPQRFQPPTRSDVFDTIERLNLIEAFLFEKSGYTEQEATKIIEKQRKETFERIYNEETKRIHAKVAEDVEISKQSWDVFFQYLAPFAPSSEERLEWSQSFTDDISKHVTPTLREIAVSQLGEMPDRSVLSDPEKFVKDLLGKYDGHVIRYVFNRSLVMNTASSSFKHPTAYELVFVLRALRR